MPSLARPRARRSATSALGLALLTAAVWLGATDPVDRALRSTAQLVTPDSTALLGTLVDAGSWPLVAAVSGGAALVTGARTRSVSAATRGLMACAVTGCLVTLMKHAVDRTGSYHWPDGQAHGLAYPSGHEAGAALASVLVLLALRPAASPRAVRAVLVVSGVVEGACLLLLDQHWSTDVLGGWLAACVGLSTTAHRGCTPARS